MTPLLRVRDLKVAITGGPVVVDGVSFDVHRGQTLGLVGSSGSGKTLSALSIAGLLPRAATVTGGSIELDGVEVPDDRRGLLTDRIGVVFQNPSTALNPRLTIGAQLREALPREVRRDRRVATRRSVELLDQVGIPGAAGRLAYYPHELSGGLNQRVVIAMAIARGPALLIADEPTTALDVTVQAQVLDLIDRLRAELNLGVLLVSHDVGVIADRTQQLAVMSAGTIVEAGPTADVLREPAHEATRHLLDSIPRTTATPAPSASGPPLLQVDAVVRDFPAPGKGRKRVLHDVSLTLHASRSLGIVGESGSGKTTLARLIVGLDRPDGGRITYDGIDIANLRGADRRTWRRDVQFVFQDPYAALDPRLSVERAIAEPVELSGTREEKAAIHARVDELLDEVELPLALRRRLPGQLSGGQRQRVVIARALALNPRLVVADEPVSALDLAVQATILDLLRSLRERRGLSYIVISHDLAVIRALCDDIAVMTDGRIVDTGPAADLLTNPQHPYTTELIDSIPGKRLLLDLASKGTS